MSDVLKCDGSTYYRVKKNGQTSCTKCPTCTWAGYGLNTAVERLQNEHGFLSCYPCVRCLAGTYRELDSKEPECTPCTLSCLRLHRYGSVPCGGASPGHCGGCRHGYTTDSKESNSMCHLRKEMTTKGQRHFSPITSKHIHTTVEAPKGTEFHVNYGVLFPAFLTILLIVCAIIAARCHTRRRKHRSRTPKNLALVTDSSKALITSNGSSIGFCNDLETDGYGHQPERARGELPKEVTINELEAMVMGSEKTKLKPKRRDLKQLTMDRVLGENDETLTVGADNISGEKRHELFHTYLKIEKSKTDPEQELWNSGAIKFSVYILNVLKIWLQRADKKATLETLCNALEMSSFEFIVDMILDLPENQILPCEEKDKDQTEITLDENT